MVGKILTISDSAGQQYVEKARAAWLQYGFGLVSMSVDNALTQSNFDGFYLIAFTMTQENAEQYINCMVITRQKTSIPIVVFPCGPSTPDFAHTSISEGANQVIALPADMEWTIANCLALIRQYANPGDSTDTPTTLFVGSKLFLNDGRYSVNVAGKDIRLQRKEYKILRYLMEHSGMIMTYSQIFRAVWGEEYADSANELLWNQIKNLRKKIQWNPSLPQYIKTRHGIGYSFAPHIDRI